MSWNYTNTVLSKMSIALKHIKGWQAFLSEKCTNIKWDINSNLYVFSFFHFLKFYWRTVDLQGCGHFCCTTKRFNYTCSHIRSRSESSPTQIITEYWAELSVLDSRSLLANHLMYRSVHTPVPNPQHIPPPSWPLW